MNVAGAVVGFMLSLGLIAIGLAVLSRRPMPIHERVDPYLGHARDGAFPLRSEEMSTLEAIYGPVARRLIHLIGRSGSGDVEVQRRLAQAGMTTNVLQFRFTQLTWAVGAAGASLALCVALRISGREFALVPALILICISSVVGWLFVDYQLSRAVRRRNDQIRTGLPSVAELLALAVASGESAQAALERVGRTMTGPLANECARACMETSTGVSFIESLEHMADRLDVVAIRRFVDSIAIAVSRGTPLADVLRAQAADARADHHRTLLEIAGRKEVLMLIPLVFLILPTVVLVVG
jgi:tight adherence protein C